MDRRQFLRLTVGSVLVLPVGTFLVSACGGGYSSPSPSPVTGGGHPPAAPPQVVGNQAVYTSSVSGNHSHTFGIDLGDFASPPMAGVSGNTSVAFGHSHAVSVSMDDLAMVDAGQTVEVTAEAGSTGHTHVLTLVKIGTGSSSSSGDAGAPTGGGGIYGY